MPLKSPPGPHMKPKNGSSKHLPQVLQGSLHYTLEHCLVHGGVPLFWWKKPCSNGQNVSFKEPCPCTPSSAKIVETAWTVPPYFLTASRRCNTMLYSDVTTGHQRAPVWACSIVGTPVNGTEVITPSSTFSSIIRVFATSSGVVNPGSMCHNVWSRMCVCVWFLHTMAQPAQV